MQQDRSMTNGNFRQIINQLDMRWRRRVPVIHQTETAECGLACLAMICGHFGKNIDLISLRRKFNLSARGANWICPYISRHLLSLNPLLA
ncbi:hypothetical protein HEK87_023195, partial [Escherichia coli]|nr:hypothetical protein [Escherichia coli]